MKIVDVGVHDPSFMEFTMPSQTAKELLYYVTEFGHFYCDHRYSIARENLDSLLLIYVCEGQLYVECDGEKVTVEKDQIALVDCRKPHKYFCLNSVEFLWFHFLGGNSAAYTKYLYNNFGIHYQEKTHYLRHNFERIMAYAQEIPNNEHRISGHISQIFAQLAAPNRNMVASTEMFEPVLQYIRDHYAEMISVDELAALCHMSVSHFVRSFGRSCGLTPHEYVLQYRLHQAKQQLLMSTDSVETISEKCGFNSASHFARAFRKEKGISPTEFRKLEF